MPSQLEEEIDEIEEIIREEMPTALRNLIADGSDILHGRPARSTMIIKYSPATQIAVGSSVGFVTGWVLKKMTKTALAVAAAAAIIVPIAEQTGYLNVNWKKVERDAKRASKDFQKELNKKVNFDNLDTKNLKAIAANNPNLSYSLAGGAILGFLAS